MWSVTLMQFGSDDRLWKCKTASEAISVVEGIVNDATVKVNRIIIDFWPQ